MYKAILKHVAVPPGQKPPLAILTPTDHTPWLLITAIISIICVLFFGLIRLYVRIAMSPGCHLDDVCVAVATFIATVQTFIVVVACRKGLGKSIELVPIKNRDEVQQLFYASIILSTLAIGLSKAATVGIMLEIATFGRYRICHRAAVVVVAAWTIASILALCLQCDYSRPWQSLGAQCPGSDLRWQLISSFDILTEVVIVCLAVSLVWSLQISLGNKVIVVNAFGFRLLAIIAIAFRLRTFNQHGFTTNPTLKMDLFIVWTQTEMCYDIISATIPILRPFMKSLSSLHGGLGVEGYLHTSSVTSGTPTLGTYCAPHGAMRSRSTGMTVDTSEEDQKRLTSVEHEMTSFPSERSHPIQDVDEDDENYPSRSISGAVRTGDSELITAPRDITWKSFI